MATKYSGDSFYAITPISNRFLGIWQPINVPSNLIDQVYIIPTKYELRPDLAANQFYGNPKLWYIFGLRNKDLLVDPIYDFKAGLEIFIPSRDNIQGF